MTPTEEEMDTCQNNDVRLGFQHPEIYFTGASEFAVKKNFSDT